MHRSRLAGFIIDCRTDDLEASTRFWSEALGLGVRPSTNPEDANYRRLDTGAEALHIEVQQVDHPSRVHLDIETDDIEAEVRRLEKLGAREVARVRSWVVMEAPTGQRFCIVRVQNPNFHAGANQWNE
jgi:predicted enzyme related to lactoylglutathione lyase